MISARFRFGSEDECTDFLKGSFGLIPQYTGDLVHYVESKSDDAANFGSRTEGGLGFHNDGYDYTTVPSYIGLYCLQSDCEGGETYFSDFKKAWKTLDEEQVATLLSQEFFFQTDPAEYYNTPSSGLTSQILDGDTFRFSYAYIKRLSDDEHFNSCLDALNAALVERKEAVKLEPGDLILINNKDFAHGRGAFKGSRKLARYWLSSNGAMGLQPRGV